jgi:hypothetical protein
MDTSSRATSLLARRLRGLASSDWTLCGALMAAATLFRVLILARNFPNVDSDQAVIGVMADHIRAGQRPLMYYGQPYQGGLEAYAAALLPAWRGPGDWALRLPVLACSVLFVGAIYALGATLYDRRTAALAGLIVALGPAPLIYYGDVTGFGYIEVALLGTVLLILQARHPDLSAMPPRIALAVGFLAGLGAWIEPLMIEYLPALAVAYTLPLLGRRPTATTDRPARARTLAAIATMAASFIAGAAPLLLYNLRHRWATLSYLFPQGRAHDDHLAVAVRLVTESLPILLGLAAPNPNHAIFARLATHYPVQHAAGVALVLYIVARLLPRPRGGPQRRATGAPISRDGTLALFGGTCALIVVCTHFDTGDSAIDTARYLLPLYTLTPLVVHRALPRRLPPAALVVGCWLAAILPLTLATPQTVTPPGPVEGLIRLLEARGVRVVYGNYWTAYQVEFESHERIVGIPVNDLQLARVRALGDLDVAARTPTNGLAWIFAAGGRGERRFHLRLKQLHIDARRVRWAGLAIYDHASRPLRAIGPYEHEGMPWFEAAPPMSCSAAHRCRSLR